MKNNSRVSQVASGTGIGLFGTMTGAVLQLFTGMVLVRLISTSDYGVYSMAAVMVSIAAMISNMGFGNGGTQLLARYMAKENYAKAKGIMQAMLVIVMVLSTLLSLVMAFYAEEIAALFNKSDLAVMLPLFAIILMPSAITLALFSIFRGFRKTWPKVLFGEILNRTLRMFGLLLVAFMGWRLFGVLYVTIFSTLFIFFALCIYSRRVIPQFFPSVKAIWGGKKLVLFSLPLFGNNLIEMLINSSATLLLGFFNTAEQVGFYNIAMTLSRLLQMPLTALAFIFLPVATAVHQGKNIQQVEKLYVSSTKWIVIISTPILMAILLDTEFIVRVLFGEKYLPGADAVRILAVGYFMHAAVGPNGLTLLAFGARRAVFFSSLFAAGICVYLSIMLMPTRGAIGAAMAVAIALIFSNLFISVNLYYKKRIHPLKAGYIKPIIFFILVTTGLAVFIHYNPLNEYWQHGLLMILILLSALLAPLITKSIDETDLVTLKVIESKFSSKTILTKKIALWCGIN